MRCPICEQEIIIGQKLDGLKRLDGKIIHDNCLTTIQAVKKMMDSIGCERIFAGMRVDCKPYRIHKARGYYSQGLKREIWLKR